MRKTNPRAFEMKTATVGQVQKNFARVIKDITSGEEVIVTRRGEPVAKITAIGPQKNIDWPDFFAEGVEIKGRQVSDIVSEERTDRF
jgi:prevent-host-death family protein